MTRKIEQMLREQTSNTLYDCETSQSKNNHLNSHSQKILQEITGSLSSLAEFKIDQPKDRTVRPKHSLYSI